MPWFTEIMQSLVPKSEYFVFDDRLEVISPGRLPNMVTIEKLRFGVSFAVNPLLLPVSYEFALL